MIKYQHSQSKKCNYPFIIILLDRILLTRTEEMGSQISREGKGDPQNIFE